MTVFCWNVRGLCSYSRQRFVRSWVTSNNCLLGGVLETKVKADSADRILASTFPGWRLADNYQFSDNGRIWVVWDPSISVVIFSKSEQLILCGVHLPASDISFAIAFVYALNTENQRRMLWSEISQIHSNSPARFRPWALAGDFNQIASSSEHFSVIPSAFSLSGITDIQSCLEDNELRDLQSRGAFYTWSNHRPEDPILRKLDRVLVNDAWSDLLPESLAIFDPPGDSDHSPSLICLEASLPPIKKSFKYFSFLASHPEFLAKISEAWLSLSRVGCALFTLGQKLNAAKACCRSLNRQGFANIQQKTKEALTHLEAIQRELLSSPSDALFQEEVAARATWNFFADAQESFYRQKSRIRWLKDGDANTNFFFKAVVANQARNAIKVLRDPMNNRIDNPDQIKDMIVTFYRQLLGTEVRVILPFYVPEIQAIHPFRCSQHISDLLVLIPSDEEIKAAIFSMPRNKAPGPDGFPLEFFLEAWSVVGDDIIAAVKDFFSTGFLLRRFNYTVIALLPKFPGADQLTSFRPVSCCTTVYKIIARILKRKLQLFTAEAVQLNQVGFIKGRLLCENVLLASELVDGFHKEGATSRGCLQIDITKAFDSVNWSFLIRVLEALELPSTFVHWISECISSTSFSIAFNGGLIGFFKGMKGLRQGDPISSLLFAIVMDILSKKLDQGAANQVFQPHLLCISPLVTHLSFADDLLIFFDGSETSLIGILGILEEFKSISGLAINREKSFLFLDGGNLADHRDLCDRHGLALGSLPMRYLGVPLTSKKMTKHDYQLLVEKIAKRFSSWTVRQLSFAGRLQLVQAVIYSTINFWASIFILPNQCIATLERMCNAFLWSGAPSSARGARISWDSVCSPKSSGGLGLRRLHDWNKVLGLKLIWLIFTSAGSLWVSWIRLNRFHSATFWDLQDSTSGSWIWKRLYKLRHLARPFLFCEIGSGITTNFWHDDWTSLGPLLHLTGDAGPRCSGLPIDASVADAIADGDWWLARSRSRHPIISLLRCCLPPASPIVSSEVDDCFKWKIGPTGTPKDFSSSQTWKALHPHSVYVPWNKAVWFKGRIPKHAFLCWIAARHRMLTRDRLRSWGMDVPSTCLLCNANDESLQHLFFSCPFSSEIWSTFYSAAMLNPPSDFDQCLLWLLNPTSDANVSLILRLAFQASLYGIWRERNARFHTATSSPVFVIVANIKKTIRCRLDPLTRAQRISGNSDSLLATYFSFF
ncbi:uncharacterized protein LOC112081502 [Eutrema salsugineum]|uniref:uncharacterized protein LOC112081502 n=1 Tax=Eutrema salsugineum TaxID=72664 RepID=UPI000CED1770|nr:uncharacterized protein LOC112081502 [Eutrema salsugineum]